MLFARFVLSPTLAIYHGNTFTSTSNTYTNGERQRFNAKYYPRALGSVTDTAAVFPHLHYHLMTPRFMCVMREGVVGACVHGCHGVAVPDYILLLRALISSAVLRARCS